MEHGAEEEFCAYVMSGDGFVAFMAIFLLRFSERTWFLCVSLLITTLQFISCQ
jgi:hypothetical protein